MLGFLSLDAKAIPPRQRPGYVSVAVSRWVPFEDGQHHVEWAGDRAMVWAWSRGALAGDEETAIRSAPRRVWPETLFRGQPQADGEALVPMHTGVEGRIWRDHALVASEWWPVRPDLAQWNRFRRGAGLAPAAVLPVPADAPLAAVPWSRRRNATGVGDIATRYRAHAFAAALAVAVALLAAPAVSALKYWMAGQRVEREMTRLDAGASRVLDAREAAIRDVGRIHDLLSLRPPAGQIELLAATASLLPQGESEILEWRMPEADTLEVDVRLSQPDPAAVARAWEASPLFEQVTVELGQSPETVRIRARIVPRVSRSRQ